MQELGRELDAGVLTLTMNRESRMNSLSTSLRHALLEAFADAATDPSVAVIVLTGAGDRAFCAGRDLKELADKDQATGGASISFPMGGVERNVYEALLDLYKPTIACINGAAVGGGLELAMACDLRVAVEDAKIGLPEAKRSMGANFGSVIIHRLLPRALAFEVLYTGRIYRAADFAETGFFTALTSAENVRNEANELAREIAANAPLTLQRYKHVATKSWGLPVTTALRLDVGPDVYGSEDRQEGVRAFVEGRAPVWRGR